MTDKEEFHHATIIILGFWAVCATLLFILTCYSYHQHYQSKDKDTYHLLTRARLCFAFFAILFGTMDIILLFTAKLLVPGPYWVGIPNIMISHTWAFGGTFGYLLFLQLVYDTFKYTTLAPSRLLYIVSVVLILAFWVAENTVGVLTALITTDVMSVERAYSYIGPCLTLGTVADILVMTMLLLVFAVKLMKITADSTSNTERRRITLSNRLGCDQQEYVYIVTKQTVLTLWETIANQMIFIASIIISKINASYVNDESTLISASYAEYMISASFEFLNMVCIFLTLEFNYKYYQRICWCCHYTCNAWCAECTKTVIKKVGIDPEIGDGDGTTNLSLQRAQTVSLKEPLLSESYI